MQTIMNKSDVTGNRKELRNHSTSAEATLWKMLKGKQIAGLKFRCQHSVGPYILDFYCPQIKLAIELDGEVHNRQQDYDEQRSYFLNRVEDIEVLRIEEKFSSYHLPPLGYSSSREEENGDSTVNH